MREVERIEDQLQRAFAGEAWHGPSVLEIIEDITREQAAARPLAGAHSIWELVLHIAAWERAIVSRLSGDRAQLTAHEDWPRVAATTEEAWQHTKQILSQGHHELRTAIAGLDESRLDQPIIEGMSSVYVTLHGILQHYLYHAGQIALLKKAVLEGEQ
ncbi:MAG TPA: DinB family protein [Pyrinomonadaceae bacterium]|nr:DinB family protein [Pyrinomonadaceae bacterium]